jgi:group I intron endonuclease
MTGIYIIQSISHPERVYVGSATDFSIRWAVHRNDLKKGKHGSKKLQYHYNKYGIDDLAFEVLESGDYFNKNHLLSREQGWFYPYKYKDTELPYFNTSKIAGSRQGSKASEESKQKMRKPMSEQAKINMSIAALNRSPDSEETRQKRSESAKKRFVNRPPKPPKPLKVHLPHIPWNKGLTKETHPNIKGREKGYIPSDETLKKQSESHLGKKQSKDTIDKIKKTMTGKQPSPIAIENSIKAHLGSHPSKETLVKLRNSHLGKKQTFDQQLRKLESLLLGKYIKELEGNMVIN